VREANGMVICKHQLSVIKTLARSLTLRTFQVAEGFALPAATASSSLRFTVPLLAAEHLQMLGPRCGTACHRRLHRHRLWPTTFHTRHKTFLFTESYPDIRLIWHLVSTHCL